MRTHITGITANFSEHSDAMIEGANTFFRTKKSSCDYVKTGEFADNFCPFSDTIINTASKKQRSDDVDSEPNQAEVPQKEDEPTLISDEGPSIQLMAEHFGWNQIFDRKHVTTKIVLNWGGLDNPDKFRDDVHQILNETDQEEVSLLIEAAISEHTQPKAQAFLEKISENRNKICFAYTHRHFTAGHVADQRGESLNGVIKTGGMKKLLVKSTFPETY